VQAAAVEIFGRLAIKLVGLLARLGDADGLQKPGLVGVRLLAKPLASLPEAGHRRLPGFVAEIGEIAVDVVHLRAPAPSFDRAAARDPDRRTRLLHRRGQMLT